MVSTQHIHVLAFNNIITCSRVVCLEVTSDSSLSIFLISLLIWYSCSCSSVCSSWIFSWRNCNDWQWNSVAGKSRLSFPTLRGSLIFLLKHLSVRARILNCWIWFANHIPTASPVFCYTDHDLEFFPTVTIVANSKSCRNVCKQPQNKSSSLPDNLNDIWY